MLARMHAMHQLKGVVGGIQERIAESRLGRQEWVKCFIQKCHYCHWEGGQQQKQEQQMAAEGNTQRQPGVTKQSLTVCVGTECPGAGDAGGRGRASRRRLAKALLLRLLLLLWGSRQPGSWRRRLLGPPPQGPWVSLAGRPPRRQTPAGRPWRA